MPGLEHRESGHWRVLGEGTPPPVDEDTTAPTVPGNVRVSGTPTQTTGTIAWNASTDAVGVVGYEVQRGVGTIIARPATPLTYTDSTLTASQTYQFRVRAFDQAGNRSAWSTYVSLTTATGGGGGTFKTLIGMRVQNPDVSTASATYAPYGDLAYLRVSTSQITLQTINDDLYKGYAGFSGTGPLFGITTEYARSIGGSILSPQGSAMIAKYGAHIMSCNQSDWQAYANNTTAARNNVQAAINALPGGVPLYLIFVNEPSLDLPATGKSSAIYCAAVARFAEMVKTMRGSKLIYPATAYTRNSVANLNTNQILSTASEWNCAPNMQALGLNPATDLVMAQHGYAQEPQNALDAWTAMFNPVYDLFTSWGFRRFAFSEGASKNRSATHFSAMPAWLDDLKSGIIRNQLEFFVYYNSGGTGGIAATEGWWIAGQGYQSLTNANRIKFAQMALSLKP